MRWKWNRRRIKWWKVIIGHSTSWDYTFIIFLTALCVFSGQNGLLILGASQLIAGGNSNHVSVFWPRMRKTIQGLCHLKNRLKQDMIAKCSRWHVRTWIQRSMIFANGKLKIWIPKTTILRRLQSSVLSTLYHHSRSWQYITLVSTLRAQSIKYWELYLGTKFPYAQNILLWS